VGTKAFKERRPNHHKKLVHVTLCAIFQVFFEIEFEFIDHLPKSCQCTFLAHL